MTVHDRISELLHEAQAKRDGLGIFGALSTNEKGNWYFLNGMVNAYSGVLAVLRQESQDMPSEPSQTKEPGAAATYAHEAELTLLGQIMPDAARTMVLRAMYCALRASGKTQREAIEDCLGFVASIYMRPAEGR